MLNKQNFSGLFFVFILLISFNASSGETKKDKVCFKKNCFDVELAISEEERVKGLQNRDGMPEMHGMLFIFSQERKYNFWMKDTKFPLDMIWLDSNRNVVFLQENVPPCLSNPCPTYPPSAAAMYVLELNAGLVRKLGIHLGDRAEFKL